MMIVIIVTVIAIILLPSYHPIFLSTLCSLYIRMHDQHAGMYNYFLLIFKEN